MNYAGAEMPPDFTKDKAKRIYSDSKKEELAEDFDRENSRGKE